MESLGSRESPRDRAIARECDDDLFHVMRARTMGMREREGGEGGEWGCGEAALDDGRDAAVVRGDGDARRASDARAIARRGMDFHARKSRADSRRRERAGTARATRGFARGVET